MFRQFKDTTENDEARNWEWLYRAMFRKSGLRIGFPRSDTCDECDKLFMKLKNLNDQEEEYEMTLHKQMEHHLAAENGYGFLRDDTEKSKVDQNYQTLCVDLQGVSLISFLFILESV